MEMNRKEWLKIFREFLIDNGCLNSFIVNSNNKETTSHNTFITQSFNSKWSPEGYWFWCCIDDKWQNLIRKKENDVKSN